MTPSFHFDLPSHLIAQSPTTPRDHSRLLLIDRRTGRLAHHRFSHLPQLFRPTDVVVFNQTQVIPARLFARKPTGGRVEILLLRNEEKQLWEVISKPGLKPGQTLVFSPRLAAQVVTPHQLRFSRPLTPALLSRLGHTPLPPYIHSVSSESLLRRQYQTVFATQPGSAAAPTAGLHFTPRLLNRLRNLGIRTEFVTLHVGLGTFQPPTPEQLSSGTLHHEFFRLTSQVARRLNAAKAAGHRIIAVGTTTTRVLETCTDSSGRLHPASGDTHIFIRPPYRFKFIDGLITNFHLPGSSLLMLISAFASWPIIKRAYQTAISEKYRFFSFGDATFIS